MTARARGLWPPLDVVGRAEGREDDLAQRLHEAEATIAAIGEWTRVEQDPAAALAEIDRLVQLHHNQRWVSPDPHTEAARVRRADGGESDD